MKKSMIEAIVTGVLVVVLVILVLTKLTGKETPRQSAIRNRQSAIANPPAELLTRIEELKATTRQTDPKIKEKQKKRASLPWGRDPFSIAECRLQNAESAIGRPPLVCRGIVWTGREPIALMNYAIVREGETIKGYVVEQITEDKVVLTKRGKTYVLRIGEE